MIERTYKGYRLEYKTMKQAVLSNMNLKPMMKFTKKELYRKIPKAILRNAEWPKDSGVFWCNRI